MNNMGFFNPFGSSGSGGGGGGSTANYSVKAITDSSGQVSYKLTKNGTAVGDVISFNGSNMLVSYGGELVVLNSAIAGIEEALDKTYNFTTFTEFGINTQNKTLSQLSAELAAKNLEEGTVVTGRVYSEALPYNNYGNAEVLVNNSILWWKTSSSTISPYSWNAIVVGNTVKMDWTPTYYQLPIASAQSLGGVKIGDNVQIAPDGTISVITTKGDTGTGIASIAKTSSSGLNDIYTITYTDSTTSTFTVTNGATITGGSIGQTGHLILTMSDGRTIDAGALPTDNEVEVTTTSSQPADPNVELWVDLSTQQTLDIPEINDSSTSSIQDTWSCKKIYDDQQRQETEMGDIANAGAKNLLKIDKSQIKSSSWNIDWTWSGDTASNGNASITINQDNTFTVAVSNTMTAQVIFDIYFSNDDVSNIILSGCPSGGSASTHFMYVKGTSYYDTGNGVTFSKTGPFRIAIVVAPGHAAGTYVFKPMLRYASITDGTFMPYALSNPIITPALIEQVDNGAKNKYPPFETQSSRGSTGVTYSYTNGIVHATGTKSGSLNYIEVVENRPISELGFSVGDTLILFNTSDSLLLTIILGDGTTFDPAIIVGNETKELTIGAGKTHIYIRSQISSSVTGTINLSATPMICTKAAWDVSHQFEPYAFSNPILTPALIEQVDSGAKNVLNSIATTGSSGSLSWTVASDGTITVNGNNDTGGRVEIHLFGVGYIPNIYSGMLLSGCKNGRASGQNPYYILVLYSNNGSTWSSEEAQYDAPIIIGDSPYCRISIMVPNGATLNNVVFKPMICTLADWNVSQKYVPYAMSNSELTEEISITPKVVYTNSLLVSTGTTIAPTGLEYTIQGTLTDTYRITAVASYNASQPDEIRLVNKTTGALYGTAVRNTIATNASVSVTGCVAAGASITIEVQAKYVGAGNNIIRMIVEKIQT